MDRLVHGEIVTTLDPAAALRLVDVATIDHVAHLMPRWDYRTASVATAKMGCICSAAAPGVKDRRWPRQQGLVARLPHCALKSRPGTVMLLQVLVQVVQGNGREMCVKTLDT